MATVQELQDRLYHKYASHNRQLDNAMYNPETNAPDLGVLNFPDENVGNLCFQVCSALGLGTLVGASARYASMDMKHARPFIVRAALPSAFDRYQNLWEIVQKLKPVENYVPGATPILLSSTAETFFKEVLRCYGALFSIKQCHDDIHDGAMIEHMGDEQGRKWGPKFFCPTFHLLELQAQDFDTILVQRSPVFCSIAESQFFSDWASAIESGTGLEHMPWWLSEKMKNIHKSRMNPDGLCLERN